MRPEKVEFESVFSHGQGGQQSKTKQMHEIPKGWLQKKYFLFGGIPRSLQFFLYPISLLSPPPFFYTISPSPSSASSSSSPPPLYLSSFTPSSFFLDFVLWVYIAVKCYWSQDIELKAFLSLFMTKSKDFGRLSLAVKFSFLVILIQYF